MTKMETAAAAAVERKSSKRWWFDRHTNDPSPKRSLWLHSTLKELDDKTMAMLKIIDEDADSFAKRAEMYYKKRPELIGMVEDMYRSHRSLAVGFDQLKTEAGSRLIAPLLSPFRYCRPEKLPSNLSSTMTFSDVKSYDSYSETYDPEESVESEVDDPEEEEAEETAIVGEMMKVGDGEEEMERMKDELKQKDEEKREVIRQLSMALDMVKEENVKLRRKLLEEIPKDPNKGKGKGRGIMSPVVELKRLKGTFFGKLFFNGVPKTQIKIPL